MDAASSTSSLARGASSSATSTLTTVVEPSSTATTQVIRKTNRSRRTALLQSTVKLISPRILKFPPPEPAPEGSPELTPPEHVFDHCNVRQRQIGKVNIRIYEVNARASLSTREAFIPAQIHDLRTEKQSRHNASSYEKTAGLRQIQSHEAEHVISRDFASSSTGAGAGGGRRRKHIYYFAGGGWQAPASPEHWKLAAHIAYTMTRAGHPTTVSIVSYPLAPHMPAHKTLPMLELFYYEILPSTPPSSMAAAAPPPPTTTTTTQTHQPNGSNGGLAPPKDGEDVAALGLQKTKTRYVVQDEDVIFAGDSAGANVALSLVLNILAQNPRARVPKKLLLISPPVDLRNSNPDMAALTRKDPVLGLATVNQTARAWTAGAIDRGDPRVSPLQRDVTVLARRNVAVDGVVGGADVLAPDARLLRAKCAEAGVRGAWLEWERMMHCFPLAFAYGRAAMPEAREAVDWIVERLKTE